MDFPHCSEFFLYIHLPAAKWGGGDQRTAQKIYPEIKGRVDPVGKKINGKTVLHSEADCFAKKNLIYGPSKSKREYSTHQ